jgi:anti-anti-sigma factor
MTGDASRRPRPWPAGRTVAANGAAAVDLDQLFDGDSLYALRAAVAAHGSQAGLSEGRTRDLVLVVHELAANAVRHGAGRGRLRLWITRDAVHCEVIDDPAASPDADGPPDAAPASGAIASGAAALWRVEPGHGLWLVRRVADRASLQSGPSGTVAAVSFQVDGPGEPSPFRLAQRQDGGCTILAVTGQLDLGSAREFGGVVDELIAGAPGLRLVLDLTGLSGWDSSGLAALITAQQRISHNHAARMILAGLPAPLVRRLREADPDGRFTLAGSTAAAVDALTSPGLGGQRPHATTSEGYVKGGSRPRWTRTRLIASRASMAVKARELAPTCCANCSSSAATTRP